MKDTSAYGGGEGNTTSGAAQAAQRGEALHTLVAAVCSVLLVITIVLVLLLLSLLSCGYGYRHCDHGGTSCPRTELQLRGCRESATGVGRAVQDLMAYPPHMYICIYIYIEREREMCIIYIYIYIYIYAYVCILVNTCIAIFYMILMLTDPIYYVIQHIKHLAYCTFNDPTCYVIL